ncbi:MAG: valine--tRNA ligase [Patescibacteria group bacterium UBA2103]
MDEKFNTPYNPQETESRIYQMWEDSKLFNPDEAVAQGHTDENAESYTIVLPPPNVTGVLHMGHASMLAIEDTFIRYNRMQGKKTLWIPGTDSASIATQNVVEKKLKKEEKLSRHDIGREGLLEKIAEFVEESKNTIISQIKGMGASLDWSRYAFTMDEKRYAAVNEAFIRMFNAGLIVRGHRSVNWDPKGQTVISDDELDYKEEKTKFYYLKYGPFTIGTARPETKFGDKYVVMHPDDERYKEYEHGQKIEVEWINGPITATIIKDEAANPEFGSGVMTITPWHSQIDFEIAQRHNLEYEQIIDFYGKLLPVAGEEFAGMKIADAREKIIEKLESKGLVEKIDDNYVHNIATGDRTGAVIEPQIMEQWFIDVNKKFTLPHSNINGITAGSEVTLKELMIAAVKNENIEILPERFNKIYFHWVENLRPWCISRQIWYGHRIPVWYKGDEIKAQVESPGDDWKQDEDTLDTWFSSGLWTLSTLGWPEKTKDLETYHPTSMLETGYDIIFFWVARMILMTTFLTGDVPFKKVFLHGMVRDNKGQKMSKSKGNGIDPLDLISEYGADAARFALITGAAPGNDIPLDVQQVKGYKRFTNKIWNASRFVLMNTEGIDITNKPELSTEDQKDIDELHEMVAEVEKHIDTYRLDLAADRAYHYFWHTFADIIIEKSKKDLEGDNKEAVAWKLHYILRTSLKTLHPFMPFVTEEVWQSLPETDSKYLLVAKWPKA